VSLEMLKAGWAMMYEKAGAEYGSEGMRERFQRAVDLARHVHFLLHVKSLRDRDFTNLGTGARERACGSTRAKMSSILRTTRKSICEVAIEHHDFIAPNLHGDTTTLSLQQE
jgi:hypothetical protein